MKTVFQSKTVLFNLLVGLAALWPPAVAWITAHPEETLALLMVCNLVLRAVTKDKLVLFSLAMISLLSLPSCVSLQQPEVAFKFRTADDMEVAVVFAKLLEAGKNPITSSGK